MPRGEVIGQFEGRGRTAVRTCVDAPEEDRVPEVVPAAARGVATAIVDPARRPVKGAEEYLDRLAALEPFSPQEVVAWLGIPLDEFPAWACAHLESELASINELARTFRDNEEPAALVRQIDDRIAELKRLITYWAKR